MQHRTEMECMQLRNVRHMNMINEIFQKTYKQYKLGKHSLTKLWELRLMEDEWKKVQEAYQHWQNENIRIQAEQKVLLINLKVQN